MLPKQRRFASRFAELYRSPLLLQEITRNEQIGTVDLHWIVFSSIELSKY